MMVGFAQWFTRGIESLTATAKSLKVPQYHITRSCNYKGNLSFSDRSFDSPIDCASPLGVMCIMACITRPRQTKAVIQLAVVDLLNALFSNTPLSTVLKLERDGSANVRIEGGIVDSDDLEALLASRNWSQRPSLEFRS
jgi:hypothetical protein